jgi:hypothetical protein
MEGHLYIISSASYGTSTYKLGYTKYKNHYRVSNYLKSRYSTYSPQPITVIKVYHVLDAKKAESHLFAKLKNYRVTHNKEFFKCNLNLIQNTCLQVQNTINKNKEIKIITNNVTRNIASNMTKQSYKTKRQLQKDGLVGEVLGGLLHGGSKMLSKYLY